MDLLVTHKPNRQSDGSDGYDLIVIDPPWENRSVHRGSKYQTLPNFTFFSLPVGQLLHKRSIVAVWVTNRQKLLHFVKNELLPHWNLQYVAAWHWLKVTDSGEMVVPIDSVHKKPFETLIIGVPVGTLDDSAVRRLQAHKTIISSPSVHSRKPILEDLFKEFLPENAKCLELFARGLLPGWTSWGNEVVKFQNVNFFENISYK